MKLASVLRIEPSAIRGAGRTRAAELLEEATGTDLPTTTYKDENAQALAAGRHALAIRILAAFSTDELRAEIARRDKTSEAEDDEQTYDELADDLKSAQYPG